MQKAGKTSWICLVPLLLLFSTLTTAWCHPQMTSFDLVWETVHNTHFDPDFGGVNWQEMKQRYRPRIRESEGIEDFVRISNEMLHELRLSHLMVATDKMLKAYMPTLFAEGTVGVDVRWIQHRAVLTRVEPGSAAHAAGLKTGYEITHIDGRDIREIVRSAMVMPPYNHRNYRGGISNLIVGHLEGLPDSRVSILCRDQYHREIKAKLVRRKRGPGQVISDAMPPVYVDYSFRRLKGDIGYFRFNHFAPPVDTAFVKALARMRDTRGLIFDVRSNPGGYFRVMDAIIEQLIDRETPPYRFKMRDRSVDRILKPVPKPYLKPVAVLMDVTSTSCSEQFAACLQALGRAVVVGERSPGYLLGAKWVRLPNGLSFMHTVLQPFPFGGRAVEGKGVIPNIHVDLRRENLHKNIDSQLDAAIAYINDAASK